jgi:hypothetical protein
MNSASSFESMPSLLAMSAEAMREYESQFERIAVLMTL